MTPHKLWLLLGIVGATAVYGLLWSIEHHPAPRRLLGDEFRYWEAATGLDVSSGAYGEPDLLWPPAYPWFIRAAMPIGSGWTGVQCLQAGLLLLVAQLCRLLWLRWVGSTRGGWLLFFLVLVYPVLPAYTFYLWPEVLHLALFLGAVWVLSACRDRWQGWVTLGLLLGLARLTKGLLGPFLPVLLLPLALEGPPRRRVARIAVVLAVYGLVITPTLLENGRREGIYAVSSAGLFNLWVGLQDGSRRNFDGAVVPEAYGAYLEAGDRFAERRDFLWESTRQLVAERGWRGVIRKQLDTQYFRLFDRVSNLGDMLPGGAAERLEGGYVDPPGWKARLLRRWSYLLYGAILLGAVLGLVVTPWSHRPWLWGMLAFIAYNLAVLFFLHVKTRYRVQFLPVLMFWSILGFEWILTRDRPWPAPWRWIPGALAASILMIFAFGRGVLY